MKFGMPTLIEMPDITDCVRLCARLGLDFIELNMNLPQYQTERFDIPLMKSLADEYGIFYTIHLDENLNVCDFNPRISAAYTDTVLSAAEIADKLDIPLLNMHMAEGVYFTLPDKKVHLFDIYADEYLQRLSEFRGKCSEAIGSKGTKILIENTNGWNRADIIKMGIDTLLESSCFGLTFDIGHSHCAGDIDEPFIMERSGRLRHFHIHDANASSNHLTLLSGETDLPKYLRTARSLGCTCVLEIKTIDSLTESVRRLRELLKTL